MKLGIIVEGQEGLTWDVWRRLASLVEELGFGSLWRSDHLLSRLDEGRATLDTWTSLAVAAAETSRITLGPLVCPVTFYHPAMLSKSAVAVDHLSSGRLVLGLGAGWNEREHRAFGLPFPDASERFDRLSEAIEVMLALWADSTASFRGRYYALDGVDARPKPLQRPRIPILIGGRGLRRTLPVVARYADEWNLTTNSPDVVRGHRAALVERCRAIGRDSDAVRMSVAVGCVLGGSEREIARRCEGVRVAVPDFAALDVDEVPEAARQCGWVCGTPDRLVEDLLALGAAGVDRVMLQHNLLEDEDALRLLATEVLPALQQAVAAQ